MHISNCPEGRDSLALALADPSALAAVLCDEPDAETSLVLVRATRCTSRVGAW
jgi:hypothetical protein